MKKFKLLTMLFALLCAGSMWADTVLNFTTNLGQTSYSSSNVTITCNYPNSNGGDGFTLNYSSYTATVTNANSSLIISQIELTPGWLQSANSHSYARANGVAPSSSSSSSIVFTNVSSNSVTLNSESPLTVRAVKVTLIPNIVNPTVTAPTAKNTNIVYNGSEQTLFNNGSTNGGRECSFVLPSVGWQCVRCI